MRTHTRTQTVGVLVALLILSLVVTGFPAAAAANGFAEAFADDTEQGTTTPPEETTPPDETQPPSDDNGTEAPEEERTPSEVPAWTWILAGLVLLGAVIWMITRSGSRSDGAAGNGDGA